MQTDAIALLKADHAEVKELFDKFEAAKGVANKQAIVMKICTALCAHTVIEEEIFYPACQGKVEGDLLQEAYVEHDGAKVLIAELISSEPDQEFYDAKVKVLSEQIAHHVHEEEQRVEGMFAQAKAAGLNMDDLGDRMKVRKEALLAQFKTEGLPAPQTRSFTGHALVEGKPVNRVSAAA